MLMSMPLVARAGVVMGDVSGDGVVNISDITHMVSYVLTGDATNLNLARADINGDGVVNISDVTGLISAVVRGVPITPPEQDGDWVDLGLPSGTIWATRNVGASSPEDYGDYFAWGEIEPNKDDYHFMTYKWWQDEYNANENWYVEGLTKYCTGSSYGYKDFVDNKTELDPEDDAAYVHYPGGRMPSLDQINELCDECTWQWTQRNGVNGQLGTGPNGNTIFLPAAGSRSGSSSSVDSYGHYWSRTLYSSFPLEAYCLDFDRSICDSYNGGRIDGFTVRAVRVSQN